VLEAKTLTDVQAEGHKIEVLRLKSQMRKLANEHTSSEVLESLDQDLARCAPCSMLVTCYSSCRDPSSC
jgi:radical SAM protein with 4Fe4S-binding SPASM domain